MTSASSTDATDWFPGEMQPVRVGVYERDMTNFPFSASPWSYWNGKFWGGWAQTPDAAKKNNRYPSMTQSAPWRGLARKPK